tara:strand:+ start:1848 stop:1973 length:126 start_codon:yes stop_codon:yes gene_type:complete
VNATDYRPRFGLRSGQLVKIYVAIQGILLVEAKKAAFFKNI